MAEKSGKGARKKVIYMITKGNWGGAQRYVFDLATSLPKDEFDVSVAFGEGFDLEKRLSAAGVRTVRIDSLKRDIHLFSDFQVLKSIIAFLKEEKPDILHLNSSKIGGIGALAGRIVGVPKIIFTGHGWAWNENRSLFSKIIITLLHWVTVLLSHTTIAVAEKIRQEISRLPFTLYKLTVIRNGIGPIKFKEHGEARNELSLSTKERFWIGTISELHKNKGLDFLIKAFAKIAPEHPSIGLIIIGSGEEKSSLIELAQRLGIRDRVYFLGFVPNASEYLKAFEIFTLTSRTEAFPYVILETGLAQVPIIASNVGGIPEAIKDNESGLLVEPGDIEGIAKNLSLLIQNSSKATELGQAMRKRTEQLFSLESMVKKTIDIYNR